MRRLPEDGSEGRSQSQRLGSQDAAVVDEVRISWVQNYPEQDVGYDVCELPDEGDGHA